MRQLLMVASTVSPRWGSEGAVGWNWLAKVPSEWQTTLVTSRECADEVRWGLNHGLDIPTLDQLASPRKSWCVYPRNKFLVRINEWAKFRYNLHSLRDTVERIIHANGYSLIHQTTIASWRAGMPFHRLGLPSVWGPIGGGEPFPWRYASQTSFVNWIFEGGRSLSTLAASITPRVLSAVREVDIIIVTNRQTEEKLRSLGRTKPILRQPMVITQQRYNAIRREVGTKCDEKIRIISGGSVEGRKGFALTIRAMSKLKACGINADFTITGHGMELPKLRELARKCGVADCVHFEQDLDSIGFVRKLAQSHIFCFPSLRDNSPVTLLEAMAAGCVPIVLDNGGPSETVDEACGFVLPLETPARTVSRIADIIAQLAQQKSRRFKLSQSAQTKVEKSFLDQRISQVMSNAYSAAIRSRVATPSNVG